MNCRYLLLSGVFLGALLSAGVPVRVYASILGDSNGDNSLDLADPVYLLNYLYRGASPPPAGSRPDADCDGEVSLSDAVAVIEHLFLDGDPPGDFCSWEIPAGLAARGPNEQGFAEFEHEETGILFVLLPGGDFLMGTPPDEEDRWQDEGPLHLVTLSAFLVGKYEVTQAQWEAVMGSNPSYFQGDQLAEGVDSTQLPVERVSWEDVVEFSALSGLSLPSEAQWEYACRGGRSGPFGGNGVLADMGWYVENSGGRPHTVGTKRPNAYGLHDFHGNLYEWCLDIYQESFYASKAAKSLDPVSFGAGDYRVVRGGGWFYQPGSCRSGNRFAIESAVSGNRRLGLRPVISLLRGK